MHLEIQLSQYATAHNFKMWIEKNQYVAALICIVVFRKLFCGANFGRISWTGMRVRRRFEDGNLRDHCCQRQQFHSLLAVATSSLCFGLLLFNTHYGENPTSVITLDNGFLRSSASTMHHGISTKIRTNIWNIPGISTRHVSPRRSIRRHCLESSNKPKVPQDKNFLNAVNKVHGSFKKEFRIEDLEYKKNVENKKRRRKMEAAANKSFRVISTNDSSLSSSTGNSNPTLEKTTIPYLIVVEGKNDKAAVQQAVNARVVELGGEAASRKKGTLLKIRIEAKEQEGVVILTDPDRAGRHARNCLDDEFAPCFHSFIPTHLAKNSANASEVGVEHASSDSIIKALASKRLSRGESDVMISKDELEELGLTQQNGDHTGAGLLRVYTCESLGLGPCDGKQLLQVLNRYGFSRMDVIEAMARARHRIDNEGDEKESLSVTFPFTIQVNNKPFGMVMNTGSSSVKEVNGLAKEAGLQRGDKIINVITDGQTVSTEKLKNFLESYRDAKPPFQLSCTRTIPLSEF